MNYRQMNPIGSMTTNDPAYVEGFNELFVALGEVLKAHLQQTPPTKDKVLQALNALAMHAATISFGCNDDQAIEFFQNCLELGYDELIEDQEREDAKGGLLS
jgi:hypothetical protein